jgi:ferredoxin
MADPHDRVPQNATGRFFVDSSCIYCELCVLTAPTVFREDLASGWAYVFHQPATPEEIALAAEALEACPTESIGAEGYDPAWRAPLIPK